MPESPCVHVEFFGIPRERAGVAETRVDSRTIGDALQALARRYPRLAESCFDAHGLKAAYTMNLNGDRFVTDLATPLADGDRLLVLSADAGG